MHHKKVINKTSLTNMSKSGKSAYFRHIFANNFFGKFLKNFFNGFEISMNLCVFDIFFNKKMFFGHISIFFNLWSQSRKKRFK